ncbi:protein of unknown function [Aminobacter niigataensis]|nr:protein of unknown function [Aminobacter niigataensis]
MEESLACEGPTTPWRKRTRSPRLALGKLDQISKGRHAQAVDVLAAERNVDAERDLGGIGAAKIGQPLDADLFEITDHCRADRMGPQHRLALILRDHARHLLATTLPPNRFLIAVQYILSAKFAEDGVC